MATGMGRFCASPVGRRGSQDSFRALHNMDRKYYQKSKRGKRKRGERERERGSKGDVGGWWANSAIQG